MKTLTLADSNQTSLTRAYSLVEAGRVFLRLAMPAAALPRFKTAALLCRPHLATSRQAALLVTVIMGETANALAESSEARRAIEVFEDAIKLQLAARQRFGDDPQAVLDSAKLMLHKGRVQMLIGRYAEARPTLRLAHRWIRKFGSPCDRAFALQSVGQNTVYAGEFKRGVTLLLEATRLWDEATSTWPDVNRGSYAEALYHLADAMHCIHRYARALVFLRRAEKIQSAIAKATGLNHDYDELIKTEQLRDSIRKLIGPKSVSAH